MSSKYYLLVIAFILIAFCGMAQSKTVHLLTIQQLNKRVSNPDTVYVVNFWATWCGPCVKEIPDFEKLQNTYKGKPVKVLLVSMDFKSKLNEVKTFAQLRKLTTEVYLADRTSDQELIDAIDKNWSGALPGTLIVNGKKNFRKFYEQEFTYDELNKLYLTNL